MTAVFKDVKPGTRLRVLPSAAECLAPGEVLAVRQLGPQLYVPCDAGKHFLNPTTAGVLRDFELAEAAVATAYERGKLAYLAGDNVNPYKRDSFAYGVSGSYDWDAWNAGYEAEVLRDASQT